MEKSIFRNELKLNICQLMIEKNIFQIWKSETLPYYLRIFANSWKKQKGFQYFLHTDESMEAFVNEKYPEIREAF